MHKLGNHSVFLCNLIILPLRALLAVVVKPVECGDDSSQVCRWRHIKSLLYCLSVSLSVSVCVDVGNTICE